MLKTIEHQKEQQKEKKLRVSQILGNLNEEELDLIADQMLIKEEDVDRNSERNEEETTSTINTHSTVMHPEEQSNNAYINGLLAQIEEERQHRLKLESEV